MLSDSLELSLKVSGTLSAYQLNVFEYLSEVHRFVQMAGEKLNQLTSK